MSWNRTISLLGTAAILSLASPIVATAFAARGPGDLTQGEYLHWLAKASGKKTALPSNPTTTDYVNWAVARGIMPQGGWKPEAALTRDAYAQTLAQLYGVSAQKDAVRALRSEGVIVPATQLVARETVIQELSDVGFRSATAVNASNSVTPVDPKAKVFLCHFQKETISVAPSGVTNHLSHGDYLGVCRR